MDWAYPEGMRVTNDVEAVKQRARRLAICGVVKRGRGSVTGPLGVLLSVTSRTVLCFFFHARLKKRKADLNI